MKRFSNNSKFYIFTAMVLWGFSVPMDKLGLQVLPTEVFVGSKYAIATVLYLIVFRPKKLLSPRQAFQLMIKLVINAFQMVLFYLALQRVAGVNAAVLNAIGPVFLFSMSILLLHEKFRLKVFLGLGVSMLGVGLIIIGGKQTGIQTTDLIVGNLMFLLAIVLDATTTIYGKRLIRTIEPTTVAGITIAWIALIFSVMGMYNRSFASSFDSDIHVWVFVVLSGVLFGFALLVLFYKGLKNVNIQEISVFNYINPVVGTVGAVLILGDTMSPPMILGAVAVFAGLWISQFRAKQKYLHINLPHLAQHGHLRHKQHIK